jgi:hypothetical protein
MLYFFSSYKDEFIEERWSVMYLLGVTFISFPGKVDMTKAIYWLSMCRDFNKQVKMTNYSFIRVLALTVVYCCVLAI